MKSIPFISILWGRTSLLLMGLVLPILFTQCKSAGGSYQDIEYDPTTLKTPSGHGMEKKDYPFDDDGRYRKEWVRNKTTGKTRSASKLPETQVATTTPATGSAPQPAMVPPVAGTPAGYYGPADAGASASPAPIEIAAASTSTPPVVEAKYH